VSIADGANIPLNYPLDTTLTAAWNYGGKLFTQNEALSGILIVGKQRKSDYAMKQNEVVI
jgi:hypothetical protein